MSWRMLYFRCICGFEFESIADALAKEIPCEKCGLAAARVRRVEAPSVRGSGEPITNKERVEAVMTFGKEALPIETKGQLKKLLKKHGKVKVSEREFNDMLSHHESINQHEQTRELTREERQKRRAELMPQIDRAKNRIAAGEVPIVGQPKDQSAIPSDVRSVIPDAAKAATGVKETV